MYDIRQSTTAYELLFFMVQSSDHITGLTGASPTVTIRKSSGSFGSPAGAVTEIANGWYKVAGNATDTNTLGPLLLHATAASGDPANTLYNVVAYDPQDAVAEVLGLGDTKTRPIMLTKDNAGTQTVYVVSATDHRTAKTGLGSALTVTLSKDGGAFAAPSGSFSVTEISGGYYQLGYTTADTNTYGPLAVHITGTGAVPVDVVNQVMLSIPGGNVQNVENPYHPGIEQGTQPFVPFVMVDAVSGLPVTGITTFTVRQISADGDPFADTTNDPVEVGSGVYYCQLDFAESLGQFLTFAFEATGCRPLRFSLLLNP